MATHDKTITVRTLKSHSTATSFTNLYKLCVGSAGSESKQPRFANGCNTFVNRIKRLMQKKNCVVQNGLVTAALKEE
jgi:hypothetical protein